MSKFKQLEAFVCVIEEGSFAAAGLRLHLTPAAISKQIKALEESLSTELIRRNTRNLALTDIGEQYFAKAKTILAEVKEADMLILQTQKEPAGILRMVIMHYFAEDIILPRLDEFLKKYPKLTLQLELAERLPDLIREEIDLVFGISIEAYPDFVKKSISRTRYVFCASPEYIKNFGLPLLPEDLKKHRYITHSMRKRAQFVSFKNHTDIYVEPYLWLNDSDAIRACACMGLGIAKLHEYFVRQDIAAGRLIALYSDYTEPEQDIYLYYRQSLHTNPKIKAFINFYTEERKNL